MQIGSLFTRHDHPEAGAGPAVGGIMGLALVEHVILWRTVENPLSRLACVAAGCMSGRVSERAMPARNSRAANSSHGFATRVDGFATKTKALEREIPPATQAISRLTLLIARLCVLFFIGTLPQVNNYSLVTGLFYGCLCALVLWSPIVFQRKLTRCKFVFVFVIVTMLLFSIAIFYGVQHIDLKSFDYVNCMPYADGLCDGKYSGCM